MHTWGKSGKGSSMNASRILSAVSLLIAVVALFLALKKPQPVAPPQPPAAVAANAQSFQAKIEQLEHSQAQGQTGSEVRLTADEISAAIAQAAGTGPQPPSGVPAATAIDPTTAIAPGSPEQANVQEPVVSFDGDIVHGQFLTEVAGKRVYVTVSGHLGAKDGYATFQPTEFKVGDLSVPVSLVNDALQKKMLEQRERLKLPDFVNDVKVENGELVIKQK
jgi:hypothetical protein